MSTHLYLCWLWEAEGGEGRSRSWSQIYEVEEEEQKGREAACWSRMGWTEAAKTGRKEERKEEKCE